MASKLAHGLEMRAVQQQFGQQKQTRKKQPLQATESKLALGSETRAGCQFSPNLTEEPSPVKHLDYGPPPLKQSQSSDPQALSQCIGGEKTHIDHTNDKERDHREQFRTSQGSSTENIEYDQDAVFFYLVTMLKEDFEMSETDTEVHVVTTNGSEDIRTKIREHFNQTSKKCVYFHDGVPESTFLGLKPRAIKDGIVSPFSFQARGRIAGKGGIAGIPLIHCKDGGENAKMYCLSCAHVVSPFSKQSDIKADSTGTKEIDMTESLKLLMQAEELNLAIVNYKPQCISFMVEPEFSLIASNFRNCDQYWGVDCFIGRMVVTDQELDKMKELDVRGMSELLCPSMTGNDKWMRVKEIFKIKDIDQAMSQLESKPLFHGAANLAMGKITRPKHSFNISLQGPNNQMLNIHFPRNRFIEACFDVPLLEGQSGSMVYAQPEGEDDDTLNIVGLVVARKIDKDRSSGHPEIMGIQPLHPILTHLKNLPEWKDGEFLTPYEFKEKYPTATVSFKKE